MRSITIISRILFVLAIVVFSCSKDKTVGPIDPALDPSLLSSSLNIQGDNKSGNKPEGQSVNVVITNAQNSASITNDNILFLPLTFSTQADIVGVYLQILQADNYWNVPVKVTGNNGSVVVALGIPDNILNGDFQISYAIYDSRGNVSKPRIIDVSIVSAQDGCGPAGRIDEGGQDGLTVRSYFLDSQAGEVSITYEMYSKPDRMDVFYGGKWVAGTGTTIGYGSAPPSSVCYDGTDGYRPGSNTLKFQYDPKISKRIDIYLYGCFGGTEWKYSLTCPDGL